MDWGWQGGEPAESEFWALAHGRQARAVPGGLARDLGRGRGEAA